MNIVEIKNPLFENLEIIHTPHGIMYHNKKANRSPTINDEPKDEEFDVIDWILNSPDINIKNDIESDI
jgi:hypothetical protein